MVRTTYQRALWVIPGQKHLNVYDENGNMIKAISFIRLTDKAGDVPQAIIGAVVNIASSEEEMKKTIQEWKK